jgi:hypothetical protein
MRALGKSSVRHVELSSTVIEVEDMKYQQRNTQTNKATRWIPIVEKE